MSVSPTSGLWDGINCSFGATWQVATITVTAGLLLLASAGVVRSVVSAPVGITLDTGETCCRSATYFGTTVRALDGGDATSCHLSA